jgi:hypothetical protein
MHYRRRKKEDRWVNPHIPALGELMDCHIFVDVCTTDSSSCICALPVHPHRPVVFKYLFKMPDRTRFSLRRLSSTLDENELVDEYEDYVGARYLSSSEAVYRIFGFETVRKSPAIRCLPVHLEGKNLPSMRHPTAPGFFGHERLALVLQASANTAVPAVKLCGFLKPHF